MNGKQTQHNVFIRKYGNMAVIITVTNWDDFKELQRHSKHEDPDFLIGGVTSNAGEVFPSIKLNLSDRLKEITDDTRGASLAGIITGDSNAGPLWSFKKLQEAKTY